jgi:hypothetical protein
MAIKISELTSVETLDNTDVLPIVNESTTKKVSIKQLNDLIKSDITLLTIKKVDSVSDVTEENIIYLVPTSSTSTTSIYDEYLLIDGKAELLGNETVDLSDYPTKEEMTNAISAAIGTIDTALNELNTGGGV